MAMTHNSTLAQPKSALKHMIAAVMLVVFLVSGVLLAYSYRVSSSLIQESINTMKCDMLSVYQQEIETIFDLISKQIDQFLLNDDLWKMVYSDTDEIDYVVIRNVLNEIQSRAYTCDLIDSIYVFDETHPFILSNGCYRKTKFFDPVVLTSDFQSSLPISQVRSVNGRDVFSLIYRPMITMNDNYLTVVVNISVERLEEFLPFSVVMGHFIMTNESSILYHTSSSQLSATLLANALAAPEKQNILRADSQDYLVTRSKLDDLGICLYIFQDMPTVTQFKNILLKMALPVILLVLLGSVLLILAVSFYLYRPMRQLVDAVSSAGYSHETQNEYALIDHALNHLTTTRDEMEKKYRQAAQYSTKTMLHEFLINPIFNADDFSAALDALDIHFTSLMYTLFVVDLIPQSDMDLRQMAMPDESVYGLLSRSIASSISKSRIAILINHHYEESSALLSFSEKLQHWFAKQKISAYTVQSHAFKHLEELSQHYNCCDQLLREKLFWQNEPAPSDAAAGAFEGIAHLKKKLLVALRVGNKSEAENALSDIMLLISQNHPTERIDLLRHQLAEICLQIDQLIQRDGHSAVTSNGYLHFQRILSARSFSAIQQELETLIRDVLELNAQLAKKRNADLVETAKKYINDHLTQNLSLEDISQAVYLSTNYFCGIFKAETGATVMDYVTQQKIALAQRILLENPGMQINALSALLGYNNVQSFIRQFKKLTGSTPDQFRKEHFQRMS